MANRSSQANVLVVLSLAAVLLLFCLAKPVAGARILASDSVARSPPTATASSQASVTRSAAVEQSGSPNKEDSEASVTATTSHAPPTHVNHGGSNRGQHYYTPMFQMLPKGSLPPPSGASDPEHN